MRIAAIGLVLLAAGSLPAQIVLKPAAGQSAPLRPKTLDLKVRIKDAVAESKFDYVFAIEGQWRGEADFLITIPENGVVTGFAYWYQGEKVIARVTEKERARDIYKAITTRQRDPALIEMVGKRTFRVKVFPIEEGADLRVELKMVQALPSTPNGPQLSVPVKKLGKLEKIDVDIQGEGPFASNLFGRPVPNFQYRAENVSTPDLRITAVRTKRPYTADLRAARSGGAGGFFALTLTAANGVQRPRLSFSGVTVKDVMGLPSRMTPGKAYTVVGRYENVRPGARMYLAGSSGRRFTEPLDFSAAPEPNGPAAKLWAWAKIGRSASRKEIIALSVRHTVPSRYTSWIAIPAEERRRFDREIKLGDLARFGRHVTEVVKRRGIRSAQARQQIVAYRAKAKALGIGPNEIQLDLYGYASTLGARWQKEAKRRGPNSPTARRLQADLQALADIGVQTNAVQTFAYSRATEIASKVYQDRMSGRSDAAARRREAELARFARLSGYSDPNDEFVSRVGGAETVRRAREIATDEREGRLVSDARHRELARHERAIGSRPGQVLDRQRAALAYDVVRKVTSEIESELAKPAPDIERLRTLDAARRKEAPILKRGDRGEIPEASYALDAKIRDFVEAVLTGSRPPSDARAFREGIESAARAVGESVTGRLETALESAYTDLASKDEREELVARRDRSQLNQNSAARERLKAAGARGTGATWGGYRGEPEQEARNEYVRARHQGLEASESLDRIRNGETWKGQEYPKTRAELLETLTELDQLDTRPLSAEEERTKAELERKANELSARIGDPIVTFRAPEDTIGLHAVLSDGIRLPMVWVERQRRWEARFDIPAGTPDGPFVVRIDGAYADGRPISGRSEFRVDSQAPAIHVERDGTILVLKTEEDVVRAVALGPDGSRREMVRHSPGRFALRDAPDGEIRVIATDKAHNRSDMFPTEPLPKAEVIDPALNVQALARFGDRMWISTLDAGGRFEGEPTVPEVGPWPRQAAAVGRSLAVRSATGEVHLYDGANWTTVERDGTTLAADGETLLVGIVGGWIERSGSERQAFRPADLAGRVVTCLFADGDRLWIGTQGRGLYEWNRTSGTGVWHDERHGLTDDWITALGRDPSGRIVAGTFVGGALALSRGEWSVVPGTEGACVTALLGDLVATRRGLVRDGRVIALGEAQALTSSAVGPVVGWRGRVESAGR